MFLIFPRFRLRVSIFAIPLFFLTLWLEGYAPFITMLFAVTAHELGHITAMAFYGYKVRRVDILPMGALIVCPEGIPNKCETVIALSGPLASFIMGCISSLLFISIRNEIFLFSALINFVLGFFNLLPIEKLDGGKALCCYLADKKTDSKKIIFLASVWAKMIFICFLLFCIVGSNFNWGVILISITLILQL